MFSTAGAVAPMFLRVPSAAGGRGGGTPPAPRLLPPGPPAAPLPPRERPGRPREPVRTKVPGGGRHQVPPPVDRLADLPPLGKHPGDLRRRGLLPLYPLKPGDPG